MSQHDRCCESHGQGSITEAAEIQYSIIYFFKDKNYINGLNTIFTSIAKNKNKRITMGC
jgi:hypothetical protein